MELCKTHCRKCGHLNRWYAYKLANTAEKREHNRRTGRTCMRCGAADVEDVEDEEVVAPYHAAVGLLFGTEKSNED